MKKLFIASLAVICLSFAAFTSAIGPETDILGIWKISSMIEKTGDEKPFPFEMKMEILPDSVMYEYKNNPDGTGTLVRGTQGKWKLEENNTVFSTKKKGNWSPSKIVKLTFDSLVVETGSGNKMVMLKVK